MKKLSQKQIVFKMLWKAGKKGVECRKFSELRPRILNYHGRIRNLQQEGYKIDCILGRDKKKQCRTSKYILVK